MKRGLFLLFSAGIVLPSAFLMYLGMFSLRAENRLREKEAVERLGSKADVLAAQLANSVTEAMRVQKGWRLSALLDARDQFLEPIQFMPPSAEQWIPLPAQKAARLEAIERREFHEKAYVQAAADYETLAQDVESPTWKALLTMRAAGCCVKAKQWKAAEALYRAIAEKKATQVNEQGHPFGLLASLQLFDLYAAAGQTSVAVDQGLHVLNELLERTWVLAWDDEAFFSKRVTDRLHALVGSFSPSQLKQWRVLEARVTTRAAQAETLKRWHANTWPGVQELLRRYNRSEVPTLVWPHKAGDEALWINPERKAMGDLRATTLIAWCAPTVIQAEWNQVLESANRQGGLEAKIIPVRENRGPTGLVRPLDGIVPPQQLVLTAAPSAGDAFVQKRRRIYLAMIALAGFVIVVALGVTWWAIAREMEVAQLKSRFVASMSHELKTPLSIIDLVGQKLKLGRYESAQDVQDYYAMLTDETTRLKGLIEDVLDFSRLMEKRAPYVLHPMDWVPLIRQTIERFKAGAGTGLQIPYESNVQQCFIQGNADALGRVLLNLLENALKYSPPERVDIRVSLQAQNGEALLQVHDRGYGIAGDEKVLIFDRFYRGRSALQERPISGTGLGLSIVQHIVQAHGGTVGVESTPGQGSIFQVRLPLDSHA